MAVSELSRRAFLARIGVLGASAVLLPQCAGPSTAAQRSELGLDEIVALLRPVLAALARDTLNGFVAFSVPGPDAYSLAQGTPRDEPGGLEAGGTDFLIENLDRALPLPDELVRPAAAALITALRDLSLPLAGTVIDVAGPPLATIGMVEEAVLFIIQNDSSAPLSLPTALLLNYLATIVDPAALNGPFLSPFSRLSFAGKARALEMLETSQPAVVALLDAQLPEPFRATVSGLLAFIGGALYGLGAAITLIADAFATQILSERRGAELVATGVTWRIGATGEQETETAQVVVMAGGTNENPRLWFNSGLPNPNDWVGRGYTNHDFDFVVGLFDRQTGSSKGPASSARCDFRGGAGWRRPAWDRRSRRS